MFSLRLFLLVPLLVYAGSTAGQAVYEVQKGSISFNSDAPNEIIKASSKNLKGLINTEKKQFAFKTEVTSFEGFNSPLQREHFNENYMESFMYPEISFSGKVIEDVDMAKDGKYTVRAKGKLAIHGVSEDRIIYADVIVKEGRMDLSSEFKVALADHNIKIPRIVDDKLATEIFIIVKATLLQKKP